MTQTKKTSAADSRRLVLAQSCMACQLLVVGKDRGFDEGNAVCAYPGPAIRNLRNGGFKMFRPRLCAIILFGLLSLGCGDEDATTTAPSLTPVDAIVNAPSQAGNTNYWHVDFGSTTGTSDWAFFADGTGTYQQSFLAPQGVDFTWTKLGPDALLVNTAIPPFTNFSSIGGSISNGTFTAILDGNPTAGTFVLRSGQL